MKSFAIGIIMTIGISLSTAGEERPKVATPAMPILPADSRDWEEVGRFTLKEATKTADVWLYYSNTNDIQRKRAERDGKDGYLWNSHPSCGFHAIYRIGKGPWQYRKMYSASRIGVEKVGEIKPEMIRIQLCSLVMRWPGDPKPEPWTMILKLTDGVPVLVADEPRKP